MELQKLYSLTRQAIEKYNMIQEHDKIAIGISGGKDSMALLYALNGLRSFFKPAFDIVAITVDLGYKNTDLSEIKRICNDLKVEYYVVETEIGKIIFEDKKIQNPCSLCSKMRKGALNTKALELGCNKIAYAHHKDDVIETAFLSVMYEGRFSCFSPVTNLEKTGLTLIRPFIYIPEARIIGFINKYKIPVLKSKCPVDGKTKREYAHNKLKDLNLESPGVKDRIFHAVETDCKDWN